ncbi:TonB-dependent receptor [Nitrospirillum sp. BR 11163]|uniref:TonB-dependent receptor n=1 Tax=Nitrospirillum sp. BR 11163 TaxID=3104323 RepID=UPI002AFED33F|nr:TonB-dependent receptor [Nitrospirillum sp. BR 11163]MEA1674647.1 TonB-dependent receptor [Nitrospirillum sp. BR 11163]
MRIKLEFLPALALLAVTAPTVGHAQGPVSVPAPEVEGASDSLETIVVTATRRTQSAQSVPGALTVVSPADIAERHLDSTVDIPRLAANASGWNMDGRERPRFYIRGIGNGNVADNAVGAVAVYNDEVYLNNLSLQGFPLFDQARVEVLNGPQGTLWGKNATAGALQFISNVPEFETSGSAAIDLGNFGQRRGEVVLNTPLVDDQLASRLSVRYENQDGWAKDITTGKQSGDFGDLAGRFQIRDRIAEGREILINVHGRDYLGTRTPYYASPASNVNTPLRLGGYDTTTANVNSRQKLTQIGASAKVDWAFDDTLKLTSISAVERGDREGVTDTDNTAKEYGRGYYRTRPTQVSQELRLASATDQPFSWITGAYFFHEDLSDRTSSAILPPGAATTPAILGQPAFSSASYDQSTNSAAVFGNLTYRFNDQFSISGGLRWTHDNMAIDYTGVQGTGSVSWSNLTNWWNPSSVSSPLKQVARLSTTRSWRKLGWEVEPEFHLTPDQMFYIRVATGYRAGNFNTQLTVNPTSPGATPLQGPGVVNPESLISYEVGYKATLFDKRLELAVDGFYGDYSNIQVSWTATNAATKATVISLANAASGESYGGEFSFRARPTQALLVSGNVGVLQTRFTDFTGPSSASLNGNQFARAPHFTANLGADYSFDTTVGDFSVGSNWNYTGHYFFIVSNETAPALQQDGYFLGDVHLLFVPKNSNFEFSGIINNIADTRYKVQVQPYSATTQLFYYQYGAPRTWLVSAKYHF